jgi:hypothetical protein
MNQNRLTAESSVFDWRPEKLNFRLLTLVAISLLMHLFTFYLFQAAYPTTNTQLPPGAHVSVLNPANPDDRQVLSWIEVHDPAAISSPKFDRQPIYNRLFPPYRPSFTTTTPQLLPMQDNTPREGYSSIFSPQTLLPLQQKPVSKEVTFPSHLELDSALRNRQPNLPSNIPVTTRILEACLFFVGVNEQGKVVNVFLWKTSGDTEADEVAATYIRSIRFNSAPRMSWGKVRVTEQFR